MGEQNGGEGETERNRARAIERNRTRLISIEKSIGHQLERNNHQAIELL